MFGARTQHRSRSRLGGMSRILLATSLIASSFVAVTAANVAPSIAAPPTGMFTQISAGYSHTCAVDAEGAIWCWGSDSSGQLGNGATTGDQASPSQVDASSTLFTKVSAGKDFTCAIDTVGGAWCWGENASGQLGNDDGGTDRAVPVAVVTTADPFIDIAAGDAHVCAVTLASGVYCWGEDGDEQLGDGSGPADQDTPVLANADVAVSVGASAENSCSLNADGTAECWGDDTTGQLGNGLTTGTKNVPVSVSLPTGKRFTSIAPAAAHACAIASDGTGYCWGDDSTGQLGNGATTGAQSSPGLVTMPTGKFFTRVDGGVGHTCALASDGSAWCWGDDASGQVGNGSTTGTQAAPVAVVMPSAKRFTAITVGAEHSCALSTEGLAYCWGSDVNGRLGNGGTLVVNQVSPSAVAMPATGAGWVSVSAGGAHSCAVASDGTGWCWGSDADDQLGNGSVGVTQYSPVLVAMPSARLFTQISAGSNFACALSSYGTAYCWGRGNSGQLGNGGYYPQKSPYAVKMPTGKTFTQISAGALNACAVTADGLAYCWGPDTSGQIGNGSTSGIMYSPSPVTLPTGKRFVRISVGGAHACAVADDGTVYCWGSDSYGQLANGPDITTNQAVPSPEYGAWEFTAISAGAFHTCAMTSSASGVCAGSDVAEQLGDGAGATSLSGFTAYDTPVVNFLRVAAGGSYSCALAEGSDAYCWGDDASGQLGDDDTSADKDTPTAVAVGGEPYLDIEAGSAHTCAIAETRSIWCWGSDATGQVGDGGGAEDAFEPAEVGLPYPDVTLTVNLDGAGSVRSSDTPTTIACPTDCAETYAYGTKITLSGLGVTAQWPFIGWAGGCSGTSGCSLTMTKDVEVTARFGALLTMTKNVAAGATVATMASPIFTCDTTCAKVQQTYALGTYVTLTVSLEPGYTVRSWTGCDSISGTSCLLRMTASRSATVAFQSRITVTKLASRASITSSPSGISCGLSCTSTSFNFAAGSTVTLSASLASGYTTVAWTNCTPVPGSPKKCTVTVAGAVTVSATIT